MPSTPWFRRGPAERLGGEGGGRVERGGSSTSTPVGRGAEMDLILAVVLTYAVGAVLTVVALGTFVLPKIVRRMLGDLLDRPEDWALAPVAALFGLVGTCVALSAAGIGWPITVAWLIRARRREEARRLLEEAQEFQDLVSQVRAENRD